MSLSCIQIIIHCRFLTYTNSRFLKLCINLFTTSKNYLAFLLITLIKMKWFIFIIHVIKAISMLSPLVIGLLTMGKDVLSIKAVCYGTLYLVKLKALHQCNCLLLN